MRCLLTRTFCIMSDLALCDSWGTCACRVAPLAWRPRAFLFHNFLSEEECQHIISMAKSMVLVFPNPFTSHII